MVSPLQFVSKEQTRSCLDVFPLKRSSWMLIEWVGHLSLVSFEFDYSMGSAVKSTFEHANELYTVRFNFIS